MRELKDYSKEAEQLFREYATSRGLIIEKIEQDNIELSMLLPAQDKFPCDIYLGLQNGDEIDINLDEFWTTIFPFNREKDEFLTMLDGFIDGNTRLRLFRQFSRVVKGKIEVFVDGKWKAYCASYQIYNIPFFPKKVEIIQNHFA